VTNDDRAAAGSVEGTHPSYTELLNLHTRARLIHSHEEMTVTTTGTALEIPVEVDAPSASEDTPQGQTPPAATPIPPLPTSAPASPSEVGQGRWIDVDLTRQMVTAYEGATPVRAVAVSTGLPSTPTPVGQFRIWVKFRYDDMEGPGYYLRDVPYTMYFHDGYGLHGTYWHNNFGHPMSHGCVNLPTPEAEWLFHWAEVGTLVNVHH
jgi:lipoprotein-anchoring transpeptidase ErfK/SrfK